MFNKLTIFCSIFVPQMRWNVASWVERTYWWTLGHLKKIHKNNNPILYILKPQSLSAYFNSPNTNYTFKCSNVHSAHDLGATAEANIYSLPYQPISTKGNKKCFWICCFAKQQPIAYQVALHWGKSASQAAFSLEFFRYALKKKNWSIWIFCEKFQVMFHRKICEYMGIYRSVKIF